MGFIIRVDAHEFERGQEFVSDANFREIDREHLGTHQFSLCEDVFAQCVIEGDLQNDAQEFEMLCNQCDRLVS